MYQRLLQLHLPSQQSAFLWGARRTGKSSYLKHMYPNAVYYDLLDTEQFMRFTKQPYLLREEILALPQSALKSPIILDEIQKVPLLLNEVHWLIENTRAHFILCGSSARRLKTESNNLLGGRAWPYTFYPLVFAEIPHFNLLRALQHGLLPDHYKADSAYLQNFFKAYVHTYLIDEIRSEGLVRNLLGFSQFLDLAGLSNGNLINATNIARDCGVDRVTIKSYFQILVDTLLGYYVQPYTKKIKRDLILATPRFYLFDVGIANYLGKQSINALEGPTASRSFEHYIFMELKANLDFQQSREKIYYWRTKLGLEVDFIIGDARIAIEVKISTQVHREDLKGLIAFCEEHPQTTAYVVSQDKAARRLELDEGRFITILPWKEFLTALWASKII